MKFYGYRQSRAGDSKGAVKQRHHVSTRLTPSASETHLACCVMVDGFQRPLWLIGSPESLLWQINLD